jgi:hypothetical protein
MAVSQFKYGNTQWFVGLSTDTKPGVPAIGPGGAQTGDFFLETDTANQYVYNGGWTLFSDYAGGDVAALTLTAQGPGTLTSPSILNGRGTQMNVGINITAIAAGSLTVTVLGKDIASGQTYTLLASAALAATGFTRLKIGPTITAAANSIAQDYIPRTFIVQAVVATGPVTATIGVSLV